MHIAHCVLLQFNTRKFQCAASEEPCQWLLAVHTVLTNHSQVFTLHDEKEDFLGMANMFSLDIEFAVLHEVSGIRNIALCRTEPGVSLKIASPHPKSQSLELFSINKSTGPQTKRGRINVQYHLKPSTKSLHHKKNH